MEYLEHQIERLGGPDKLMINVGSEENPVLTSAGSASFTKLEQAIARGDKVDPYEGVAPEERARLDAFFLRKVKKDAPAVPAAPEEFSDDYSGGG